VGRFLGRKRKSPRSIGEKVSYRYPEKLHYPENENCHYPTEEKQFTLREKKVIDFHIFPAIHHDHRFYNSFFCFQLSFTSHFKEIIAYMHEYLHDSDL